MLKKGNGEPIRCAENLMHLIQGEVPYDRVRGIDSQIIDKPTDEAVMDLEEDAGWNIETYEPRLEPGTVSVSAEITKHGQYSMVIQVADVEDID